MYPVGQPTQGPGPVGPPPSLNQSGLGAGGALGLGGLGPILPSGAPPGPSGQSVGGILAVSDTSPLGPPGMPPPGATALMGAGSGNGSTGGTILPVGGLGLGFGTGSPPLTDAPTFVCPRRPNIGRDGRPILLRANHFQISMPRGYINHYQINIQPDKCPRKVNRDIIETMVQAYGRIFGTRKPVFDGRNNMYTRDPLPIGNDTVELEVTLPGEGRDRVFRVSIKWAEQVSLYALEEALEGRTRQIPFNAIQALDVVMRHLP